MKINKFNSVFTHQELRSVLLNNKPNAKKIAVDEIVANLFKSAKKDAMIPLFLDAAKKAKKEHKSLSKKLVKAVDDKMKKHGSAAASLFPDELCKALDLKAKTAKLQADGHKEAKVVVEKIKSHASHDPKIKGLQAKDAKLAKFVPIASSSSPPFDFNRTGRNLPGVFLNASDVHMPKQHYILSGLVRTVKCAKNYFEAAFKQNVALFVSLQERNEATSRCNGFWENKVLSQITLNDNWKLKNSASKVIATGKNGTKIVESTLELTKAGSNTRKATHLHFEGWKDKGPIPDEELFAKLLDRMDELNPTATQPIAINCKAGIGRTGTTVVSHYLRKMVNDELKSKKIDQIQVNIPKLIIDFRKQRKGIVGQPTQLSQIYSCLKAYCEKKK